MTLKKLPFALLSVGVLSLHLTACTTPDTKQVSQTELALLIEQAKAEERARIQQQLAQQQQQKSLFNEIKNLQVQKQALLDQRDVLRIKPEDESEVFYKTLNGKAYYRCGAPAQKPLADSAGKWYYHRDNSELSAILCPKSRDKKVIKALQQKLFDMGYLVSASLSHSQLVDGIWGETSLEALKSYQQYHGLLYGQLTIESLEHMGIFPPSSSSYALLGVSEIAPPTELEKQLHLEAQRLKEKQESEKQAQQARQEAEHKLMLAEAASAETANAPKLPMVTNFKVDNRDTVFYKNVSGTDYYRCAANAFIADLVDGKWDYSANKKQLSATLCKASRNKKIMADLQQRLYQLGYLKQVAEERQLTKEQVVDGVWGETTLQALKAYQADNGLVFGQLTIQSLENLGVFEAPDERIEPTSLLANLARNTLGNIEKNPRTEQALELANEDNPSSDSVDTSQPNVLEEQKKSLEQTPVIEDDSVNTVAASESDNNTTEKPLIADIANAIPWPNVTNFVVDNRKRAFYRKVGGVSYYRCAANALVPQYQDGQWNYHNEQRELSATLCKSSRDLATMTDLQYRLYEKGYLKTVAEQKGLSKSQIIDGVWGASTLEALKQYQADNGLVFGQLTIQSLEHIGVFAIDISRTRQYQQNLAKPDSDTSEDKAQPSELSSSQKAQDSELSSTVNATVNNTADNATPVEVEHEKSKPVSVEDTKQAVDNLVLLRVARDDFDFINGQPDNSQAVLAGYIEDEKIWRCGARALIAQQDQSGQWQYSEDNKQMRATLCKASRSSSMIKPLQQALADKGYLKPLPPLDYVVVDGVWGINTLSALKEYQRDNGLALGQLTLESYIKLAVIKLKQPE